MKPTKIRILLAQIFILSITFLSFYPSLLNGWTSWDDNVYVTDNAFITEISYRNIQTVFSKVLDGSYVPLTMVSYMIDYRIGGYDPNVYHTTNLLFHLCNSSLMFWLAYRLSGNLIAALTAGVLFGIHPMRVESVAWISGRKDVLSMFFFLISSISYLSYLRNTDNKKWLTLSFIVFVCAIMSKIIVLTFPLILFLYDYHQKRQFSSTIVLEKIPFIMVAGAFAIIGYFGQASIHAIKTTSNAFENVIVSFHGVVFYLEKFLLPINLSNLYPYPLILTFKFYLYAMLFFAACYFVWTRRKNEIIIFGSLFFFISLLPVLQLIRFSQIIAADRFTYFSYIGLFYIVGMSVAAVWQKMNKRAVLTICGAVIISLALLTWNRCSVWKDNDTLWKDMLSKYPDAMEQI